MEELLIDSQAGAAAVPLWLVGEATRATWEQARSPEVQRWLRAQAFAAERGRLLVLPGADGSIAGAALGLGSAALESLNWWDFSGLPDRLPSGTYRVATELATADATQLAWGWLHGSYRLQQFRGERKATALPRLVAPAGVPLALLRAANTAISHARDLINTPANLLGPAELAAAVRLLASGSGGTLRECMGEELQREYPLISAVGQGSVRAPRLLDVRWKRAGAPRVTLIGKGVCFDSGGLDLKPSSAMLLMKKDMGGAACALALAQLLRATDTPVELRLLIPAVENSVGGNAFRPGDVWRSRLGLTV